eukprot:COSAG05_NODE_2827_length_2594_cov_36.512811_3_plen_115_part_00
MLLVKTSDAFSLPTDLRKDIMTRAEDIADYEPEEQQDEEEAEHDYKPPSEYDKLEVRAVFTTEFTLYFDLRALHVFLSWIFVFCMGDAGQIVLRARPEEQLPLDFTRPLQEPEL